ncbi:hypothetical protein ACLMAL_18400 [Nocardia sp. CWNU-33]|uniref:hypothetical protein n=1 Tax=Nocardia sp. CWNU-33 TaxID=3392117 RepID=UPI00398F3597
MSAVTVAVIVGFVCCALAIRALGTANGREARSWETDLATGRIRVTGGTPSRAMMDE